MGLATRDIAKIAHQANKALCEVLGDLSQPDWELAPEWQIQSAINGVEEHKKAIWLTPADSHAVWLKHKLADGWKYGPKKDPEKKEHPCILPYDQLPLEQRLKDCLFGAIVSTLL